MKSAYKASLTILSAIFMFGTSVQADVNMQEGLWKMTVKTEMSGMPMPMAIPETSFTQCLTKKDLVPKDQNEQQPSECKIVDQKISGNTITWHMECKGGEGGKMKASGTITYNGDTMSGTTDVVTIVPQMGEMKMKQTMSGKRIGECKK